MKKLASVLLAVSLVACENTPVIKAPFNVDLVNLHNQSAEVSAGDYVLDVEFRINSTDESNGFNVAYGAEIEEVTSIKVYDENGEVEKYELSSEDAQEIKDLIEEELNGMAR
mgnify:CR=1 FL=1